VVVAIATTTVLLRRRPLTSRTLSTTSTSSTSGTPGP
jgi:hypothetical protein